MASSWRRLSRHPVDQPSVSMIVEWALMWVYRVSHCPTFSVNSLWIIGVCCRGILVSVGQSHDISLWSILSLGNRSINVEMIYKLRVFDINWYSVMSAPCWPHEPCYQGTFSNFLEWKCMISLKSVFEGPINNIPASVQIMAWRWPGDKQLSEPMVVRLPTHICASLGLSQLM